MLDDYHKDLPKLLDTLRAEHDQLKSELETELAISKELETCDQDELDDLRMELEAQT